MSTGSNLRTRIRALLRRREPDTEEAPMPFDPEWEELLAWAEVAPRAPEPAAGEGEAQEENWAALIEAARERAGRREEVEEAQWAAAMDAARQRDRQAEAEEAEWAAAIGRAAAVRATEAGDPAPEGPSEEALWQAAIQRAKTGCA
jgi:hypothetical protein